MAERNLQAEMDAWKKERDLQAEMDAWKKQTPLLDNVADMVSPIANAAGDLISSQFDEPEETLPEKETSWTDKIRDFVGTPAGAIEDWRSLSGGIGKSAAETYYGAKELAGLSGPDDAENLQRWSDQAKGGWGAAGELIGEGTQLALPGTAGLKAASMVNKAGRVARTLPLAADLAGGAALGAIKLPEEGETRRSNADTNLLYGVGGAAAGKLLKTLATGMKVSPEARALMDKGAKLTPGQSTSVFKRAEDLGELTPVLARAVKKGKRISRDTTHMAVLREAAPEGYEITKMGTAGVKQVKNAIDDAYEKAWGSATSLKPRTYGRIDRVAQNAMRSLRKRDARTIKNVRDDLRKLVINDPSVNVKELDSLIHYEIRGKGKTRKVDAALKEMREVLRGGLPKESQDAVRKVDAIYPKYLVVRNAAKTAPSSKNMGVFDAGGLMTGVRQIGGNRVGYGEGPMQDLAYDVMATLGKPKAPEPLSWWRRMADFAPTPPGMQVGAGYVVGRGPGQGTMRRAYDSEVARKLRYGITPARLGSAWAETE